MLRDAASLQMLASQVLLGHPPPRLREDGTAPPTQVQIQSILGPGSFMNLVTACLPSSLSLSVWVLTRKAD